MESLDFFEITDRERFARTVRNVLQANNFKLENSNVTPTPLYDFILRTGELGYAVSVKFYQTKRAQPTLLENAARQLVESAVRLKLHKAILIVSCHVSDPLREALERQYGILIKDIFSLLAWAINAPEELEALSSMANEIPVLDDSFVNQGASELEIESSALEICNDPSGPESSGVKLRNKLTQLGVGKKNWREYEELCIEILEYLFKDILLTQKKQFGTEDGLSRFDLICRISPLNNFWKFVDNRLSSRYVLFEFKNYSKPIKQGQILTTEKYLYPLALRSMGIIICRKGADKNAQLSIAGAMREAGKLILVLDDTKVSEMLLAKDRGEDPSDILFQLTDEFLMCINR